MIGAIIGDTVGSRFEFNNIHTKDFEFLSPKCFLTDDSIMTIAVAEAIIEWIDTNGREEKDYSKLSKYAEASMRKWGLKYPDVGYGTHFKRWLNDPSMGPYNSCGNGSAMRISPIGWVAETKEECILMTKAVTEVTHNHIDGIKGAEATAMQIFLARAENMDKDALKRYEEENYYSLDGYEFETLKRSYTWQSLCDGTCQAAFSSLYNSTSFEDAIRNCILIGGDVDTTGAICGSIAEVIYPVESAIREKIRTYMTKEELSVLDEFESRFNKNK